MEDCGCQALGATSASQVGGDVNSPSVTSPGGQVIDFNSYRAAHMEHQFRRRCSSVVMVIAVAVVLYILFVD